MSAQRTDVDLSNGHMVMIEWDKEGWSIEHVYNVQKCDQTRQFKNAMRDTLTASDLDKINDAMNEDAF